MTLRGYDSWKLDTPPRFELDADQADAEDLDADDDGDDPPRDDGPPAEASNAGRG